VEIPLKRLRWPSLVNINIFWLGLNTRNAAVGTIIIPYLIDAFVQPGLKNTALGAIRASGLIVALVAQPAFGLLSDRNTSRYGRRRPFIFVGVMLDLFFLAAIGLSWNFVALFVAVLMQQLAANVSHGALQGLIPDLVPENQRGRASAVKSVFELSAIILVALTIARIAGAGAIDTAILVTGVILFTTMMLTMLLVREQPLDEKPDTPVRPALVRVLGMLGGLVVGGVAGLLAGAVLAGLASLITWPVVGSKTAVAVGVGLGGLVAMVVASIVGVWAGALGTLGQEARRNASFTWWIVNRLFFLAAVTSIQTFAPFLLMSVFDLTREAAVEMAGGLMLVVGMCTLITALPSGWLSDRLGYRKLVGGAGIVAAGGTMLLLATIADPSTALVYVAGSVIGMAAGLFLTTNWALGTELAPAEEAGRYLGVSNLAGAGAGVVGAAVGGPMADFLNGYQEGLGFMVIMGCYSVLFLLSTASLLGVRRE
jgi:MFS family permease